MLYSCARLSSFCVAMVATRRSRRTSSADLRSLPPRKRRSLTSATGRPLAAKKLFAADPDTESKELFSLFNEDDELVLAKMVARPSKRNRSPYVADIALIDSGRVAIAHVPNLDMGGKCIPGCTLLVKAATDKKGNKIGADAVSPKYGTPKCEFHAQLLLVDESNLHPKLYPPTWVGAHPNLGERIAECWIRNNVLGPVESVKRQVTIGNMRSDFEITHKDGSKRLVEVKQVVDTDYYVEAPPSDTMKCRFLSSRVPYRRTAIFPWGNSKQKGPDGEAVVSARAINHVRELTRLVEERQYKATVLFVVVRGDAEAFRPNADSCPSFAKYLRLAEQAGVQVLAKRVMWGEKDHELGSCFDDPSELPIEWPDVV